MSQMKLLLFGGSVLFSFQLFCQSLPVAVGSYSGHLQLNPAVQLPLNISVEKTNKHNQLVIHNAAERIQLNVTQKAGDTLILPFPNFDSELRLVANKKANVLEGYWLNKNKAGRYTIPFFAKINKNNPKKDAPTTNIAGRWESYFTPFTEDKELGVGVFEQKNDSVTGTVLTETGDYRFLAGTVEGNRFFLSCFDGSHAFLLQGTADKTSITGTFFSGKHYQTSWSATRNEKIELKDADALTFVKEKNDAVSFTLPDLANKPYVFPNETTKNKVVIIQIMGTWCPNCMDETNFYKELYDKYHDKGLEIISIGYEAAEGFEAQASKIRMLKERKGLNFQFLVGGKASKSLASEQFAMLNEVISFPTSIYIGRDGTVKRVHTGFNGPGTGSYYTEYVKKTTALIEELLK